MTRNEAKKSIFEIIYDKTLSDDEKMEHVINRFCNLVQGFGGKRAKRFARQIQNETGFDMSGVELLCEIGVIEKKNQP